MIHNSKKTIYSALKEVADIVDVDQRKKVFRDLLQSDNTIAIIVQRTYHPNYNFNLPEGPLPESIAKKSNHDEKGPLYNSIRKWDIFRVPSEVPFNSNYKKRVVEQQFISLYEAVASDDAELLIGIKDKKLPWETLSVDFVVEAIPELFPPSFRPEEAVRKVEEKVESVVNVKEVNKDILKQIQERYLEPETEIIEQPKIEVVAFDKERTKKDICADIWRNNRHLQRKDMLKLFEQAGASKATAGVYYQQLKGMFNA